MLVTKILEGTLSAGQTTITFTDSAIPNSFIRVGSTNPDIFPTEQTISGNTLTIKYEAQSSALGVVVELVKAGMTINDTLTSTATDEALSANQGKALKDIIDGMGAPSIDELTNVNITDPATDDILIYDGTEEEWINTSMPNIPSDIDDLGDVDITSPSDDEVLTYDNGAWVNKPAQGGSSAAIYSGNWTATSSSAVNTKLTQELTLPKGKYVINIRLPYSTNNSNNQFCLMLNDVADYTKIASVPVCYGNAAFISELNAETRVCVASASGTSLTWDNTYFDRGGINALKIG